MPAFCCVVNCAMRGERDAVSFYRFPAILKHRGESFRDLSVERRESWIKALKRGPLTEKQLVNWRICSRHFINGSPAELEDKLNPDWVPNQNMGYVTSNMPSTSAAGRHSRSLKRAKYEVEIQTENRGNDDENRCPELVTDCDEISAQKVHENGARVSTSVQTDLTVENLCSVFSELNNCNSKIYTLQSKLDIMEVTEDSFKNNDAKTTYFTGLPKAGVLFLIHETVAPYLPSHHNNALSTFQQLVLTFMKLRLNLPFKYLSYRFTVSPTTASETFYKCIDVLYDTFKKLVFWPEREALRKHVPACFKETFGNKVAVIIDCFEVFTETPSKIVNPSQCWSTYKHHQTVKFLIGITPQGTISFISEAWGGRTSDKFLTENCGFLNLILPGDIVLADRGFLIKDSVEGLGGHLKIPAFTRGQTQLHPKDLEETRSIATVRIHVERIIGLLKKKFHIFQQTIPISMLSKTRDSLSALDKIVVVCSAFINLCPSQIPLD